MHSDKESYMCGGFIWHYTCKQIYWTHFMEQHKASIDQAIRCAIAKSRESMKPWAIKENGILGQYLTTKHKKVLHSWDP